MELSWDKESYSVCRFLKINATHDIMLPSEDEGQGAIINWPDWAGRTELGLAKREVPHNHRDITATVLPTRELD